MPLYPTGSSSADSKEARQVQQIALETAISDRLGDAVAAPAADTLNARLVTLLARFGEAVASPAANTLLARVVSLFTALGQPADAAATANTGTFSVIQLLKRANTLLSNVDPTNSNVVPTNPAIANTSTVILAADPTRKKFTIFNPGTVTVFIEYGGTPTTTAYTSPVPPGYLFVDDLDWKGAVNGIVATGTNTVLVRSFS